jgi:hypothetical protein
MQLLNNVYEEKLKSAGGEAENNVASPHKRSEEAKKSCKRRTMP